MFDKKYFLWSLIFCKIRLYLAKISEKSWFSFIAFFCIHFLQKIFCFGIFCMMQKMQKMCTSTYHQVQSHFVNDFIANLPEFRYTFMNISSNKMCILSKEFVYFMCVLIKPTEIVVFIIKNFVFYQWEKKRGVLQFPMIFHKNRHFYLGRQRWSIILGPHVSRYRSWVKLLYFTSL